MALNFRKLKGKKKRFNPSKAYNNIYRVTDEAHYALTKPHSVSATLLAEMKQDQVGCSEVGVEGRLKEHLEQTGVEMH